MVDPELVEVLTSFKDEIKGELVSMNERLGSVEGRLTSLEDKVTYIEEDLVSVKEELTSVGNTCTVIQNEHGDKLKLILDYISADIAKNEYYDKKFEKVDNKFFDHDARLAIIEGSDVYKTMIKGKGKTNLRNASLF